MTVSVFTLGCKVNQYESDLIAQELEKRGHKVFRGLEKADIYVVNTCAVTGEAERKSRQAISRCLAQNPEAKIVIVGCASEASPKAFENKNVIFFCGTKDKLAVVDLVEYFRAETPDFTENHSQILETSGRARAFVKIQDGCNNFCSYCIIPHLRGRSISRSEEEILREISALSAVSDEIVITGINIMLYGRDTNTTLTDLFRKLNNLETRLRISSFYAEGITREMLDALFSIKNFCPHFHLSLQSGDRDVLKKMNRRYTPEEYLEKINLIREYDKNASITTDIIVGFPTETDIQFENTLNFAKTAKFSDIHVFPFSPRKGTPAAERPQLKPEVIKERKNRLLALKSELHKNYLNDNIGVKQKVLFETNEKGLSSGYSQYYIKIYSKTDKTLAEILPREFYLDGMKGDEVE